MRLGWWGVSLLVFYSLCSGIVRAQTITPAQDGTGTQVQLFGHRYDITGGRQVGHNLFHSFGRFNLDSGYIANFLANPSLRNILARVTGGSPSYINGLIQVTGGNPNLYLMNPAGILFGPQATLNVPAAFIATTANRIVFPGGSFSAYGPNDYSKLSGDPIAFAFDTRHPAAIINEGKLLVPLGQNVGLIGGQVLNSGTIQAPGGTITLAAVPGENLVRLSVPGQVLSLELHPQRLAQAVEANGELPVTRLPELLTGAQTFTVHPDNTVQVRGTELKVPLKPGTALVSGQLDVSAADGSGGQVGILGQQVALVKAQVNASGATGGGQVLIGGEFQGQGPLPNADYTFVSRDTQIRADATVKGDGGRVIVWADKGTDFRGKITAQGGPQGGDGGFVEVSGKQTLRFSGQVDTSAPRGKSGTLLLDPQDIKIVPSLSEPDDNELSDGEILFGDSPGATLIISNTELSNQLSSNNVRLQATNDITFTTSFFAFSNSNTNLSMEAGNNINAGDIFLFGIGLKMGAGGNISTDGLFADKVEIVAGGDVRIRDQVVAERGGDITIKSRRGSITTDSLISITSSSYPNAGSISLEAPQDIETGFIDTKSGYGLGGSVTIRSQNNVRIRDIGSFGFSIDTRGVTGGGDIFIQHGGQNLFTIGDASVNGTAGPITTGDYTLSPPQQFYSKQLGNITIVALQSGSESNTIPSSVAKDLQESDFPTNSSSLLDGEVDEFGWYNFVSVSDGLAAGNDEAIIDLERLYTREFVRSLGVEALGVLDSVGAISELLNRLERETGIRPAIAYMMVDERQLTIVVITPGNHSTRSQGLTAAVNLSSLSQKRLSVQPIVRGIPEARRSRLIPIVMRFLNTLGDPRLRTSNAYLKDAQQLYRWLIAPIEPELQARGIQTLMFSLDNGLRLLPLAALHDGQQFLVEKYGLSLIPSINLVDTRYRPLRNASVLAMGADTFANQPPLPAVPLELQLITEVWPGRRYLNQDFTVERLVRERRQVGYPIVHLATHAYLEPGRLENSYIEFWDNQRLPLVRLRQLPLREPNPVELLTLSACRTAVGDMMAELGFAGLAVQLGVKSALASLWYVSDEGTLALMSEFYRNLSQAPIKAEALRQAQIALLRGQVVLKGGELGSVRGGVPVPPVIAQRGDQLLNHPYYWAGFTLVGSPW